MNDEVKMRLLRALDDRPREEIEDLLGWVALGELHYHPTELALWLIKELRFRLGTETAEVRVALDPTQPTASDTLWLQALGVRWD